MQLQHLINLNRVYIDSSSQSKTAVLLRVSRLLAENQPSPDAQELFESYWKREALGSTAIGQGITIPHVRSAAITEPSACLIKLNHPVDFGALDKQPIDLVIGLLVPQAQTNQHLALLAAIIKQFSQTSFREACRAAATKEELYQLLSKAEFEHETQSH